MSDQRPGTTLRANPPAVPADTSREVWRLQIEAIRQQSVAERLEAWAELNRAGVAMHEAGVRRRHPHYSDHEVFLAMVKGRYGAELAAKVWPDSVSVNP